MNPTLTASLYALVEVRGQATTAEQAPGGREHPPARRGNEGRPPGDPDDYPGSQGHYPGNQGDDCPKSGRRYPGSQRCYPRNRTHCPRRAYYPRMDSGSPRSRPQAYATPPRRAPRDERGRGRVPSGPAAGGRRHPARRGDEGGPLGGPEVSGSGHVEAWTSQWELALSRKAPGQARLGDGKGRLGNGDTGDPATRRGRS